MGTRVRWEQEPIPGLSYPARPRMQLPIPSILATHAPTPKLPTSRSLWVCLRTKIVDHVCICCDLYFFTFPLLWVFNRVFVGVGFRVSLNRFYWILNPFNILNTGNESSNILTLVLTSKGRSNGIQCRTWRGPVAGSYRDTVEKPYLSFFLCVSFCRRPVSLSRSHAHWLNIKCWSLHFEPILRCISFWKIDRTNATRVREHLIVCKHCMYTRSSPKCVINHWSTYILNPRFS